jgi:23S rRNA pseudouridine1911/1915/1917 synthase
MPSQGDASGDPNLFDWTKEYIRIKYQKPGKVYLALLHRLDRPTGGLVLMAKTSKAAARVSQLFQRKEVQKTYLAITQKVPHPPAGKLSHHLKQLPRQNIMRAYPKSVSGSKAAELTYQVVKEDGKNALVAVLPKTGRKHQIRVQLASIGCSIRGDVKYGASAFNPDKSICLLAHKLRFLHPTQKEMMELEVPVPETGVWVL